jgi:hypothetical protein
MNRDDIIRMAQEAGFELDCCSLEWHERISRFAAFVAAAEREKFQPILDAAQGVIDWTESKFREPVRDELEFGRMVYVRLHALADLYDAIRARGEA